MLVLPVTAALSVTVHVEELGGVMLAGEQVRLETVGSGGGWMVSVVDFCTPADVAVIVEVCVAVTTAVLTVKPVLVWPAATVTCAGGVAYALLLDRATVVPPAGAALASVTVQLVPTPPVSVLGVHDTEDTPGCVTAFKPSTKVLELLFRVAVIVDDVVEGTALGALTENVLLLPDVMVTGETTVA